MNIHPAPRKLLTIVCEASLEADVVRDLASLGAHGYTITDARGCGTHGIRDGARRPRRTSASRCFGDEVTDQVICARYYENFGMISFLADVAVLRPENSEQQ